MNNKFDGYFNYYISRVNEKPLIFTLEEQLNSFSSFIKSIPLDNLDFSYEQNKWTLKEVIFHIIETEIIMLYRAIRISRGDKTELPGYDENNMIDKARIEKMTISKVLELFKNSRKNTLFYFNHFNKTELLEVGNFSGLRLNTEGIGFLCAGHLDHHLEVIKERYLNKS